MIIPNIHLSDGRSIPHLGFGVWQVSPDVIVPTLLIAFEVGYRSIDTAALYGNEEGVGEAIRSSGISRDQFYVTTKVWNDRHGEVRKAFEESLNKLQLDYVDLYLIHWPAPSRDRYVQAWETILELQKEGLTRSVGVSNFNANHLSRIVEETGIKPVLNQIELHPLFPQRELRAYHAEHGIVTESWSPLGKGRLHDHPVLVKIGAKYGKSYAQVLLRWQVQQSIVVIPRTVTQGRVKENAEIFDFALDADDMIQIAALETGERLGDDPEKNS